MVGKIASYERSMRDALAISDPMARAVAIAAARTELSAIANKEVTPDVAARVDGLLGIDGAR